MDKTKLNKGAVAAIVLVVAAAVGIFAFASGDDDDDMATNNSGSNSSQSATDNNAFALDVNFDNLAPLEQGLYEGWVVRDDVKYSFGTFNTTEAGDVTGEFAFADDSFEPQDGDTVAISIEPVPDNDPEPSPTIVLAGEIAGGAADLAFPVDVSGFSGQYILATPTNGDGTNETAGIWFLSLESGSPSLGLDIPNAPDGWIYEGWVVYEGTPYSTGKFTDPATADDFDGFSGPEAGPAFPGEDFLENLPGDGMPFDLANGSSVAVISIEPYQGGEDPTGDGPAQVKPLVHDIPEGAADHSTLDMNLDTSSLPSGSANVR